MEQSKSDINQNILPLNARGLTKANMKKFWHNTGDINKKIFHAIVMKTGKNPGRVFLKDADSADFKSGSAATLFSSNVDKWVTFRSQFLNSNYYSKDENGRRKFVKKLEISENVLQDQLVFVKGYQISKDDQEVLKDKVYDSSAEQSLTVNAEQFNSEKKLGFNNSEKDVGAILKTFAYMFYNPQNVLPKPLNQELNVTNNQTAATDVSSKVEAKEVEAKEVAEKIIELTGEGLKYTDVIPKAIEFYSDSGNIRQYLENNAQYIQAEILEKLYEEDDQEDFFMSWLQVDLEKNLKQNDTTTNPNDNQLLTTNQQEVEEAEEFLNTEETDVTITDL